MAGKPAEKKGNDPAATYGPSNTKSSVNASPGGLLKHTASYKGDPAARYTPHDGR